MKKYKAVIFDMDGTILNTIEDLTIATNHALGRYGLPAVTVEEEYFFVGNGLYTTAKRACKEAASEDTVQKVYEELVSYYRMHSEDHTAPYKGIREVIRKLRMKGIKTAVVSNKADASVQHLVELFFAGCFDVAMGETEGFALKPDRAMVDEALRRMEVSNEDAVYVGDSNVDLMTAKNAELDCIVVSWGFRSKETLLEYGAAVIADKPKDLLRLIK